MSTSETLDVGGKQTGNLWNRQIVSNKSDGCFLTITNTLSSGGTADSKSHVRFLHVAADLSGDRIIGGDHHGNYFLFDIDKNKFTLLFSIGVSCTAIAWNNYRYNEILIALSNYEIQCYNVATKELVNTLKGHTSAVHLISIHGSGRYAVSSSFDNTILWDLDTFKKRRTLCGAQEVGIQQVFFLPNSNKIVSCFKDDSIFVWDCETMKCLYQLTSPSGHKSSSYRCLASTADGQLLVSGGKSRYLHLWNLDTRQLVQVIELPLKVKEVKSLAFVADKIAASMRQVVGVLGHDGVLRLIDLLTCKLRAEVGGGDEKVHRFVLTKNNRHVVSVLDNGNIAFHHLIDALNPRAAPPIVKKVVDSDNKSDDMNTETEKPSLGVEESVAKTTLQNGNKTKYRGLPEGLNMKRLKTVLKGYGEYPEKYRLFIWRSILRIPENFESFGALVDKQTHSAFVNIHEKFPIKSRKLLRVLQRVLSALAYWSPIFGETEFLPMIVFPFVKLWPNSHLVCFEMVATILLNWCEKWFEYFPNPPLSILVMIESLLGHHDAALLEHFINVDVSAQVYAWPMMHTLFSEVLTKEEWMIVWDNLFSNHPSFMLHLVVSYLIHSRNALLTVKSKEKFDFFFHHRNAVDIHAIVKDAYRLANSTPSAIDPKKQLSAFSPLPEGQYPVFDGYPRFVVDYLVEERERIREDELQYLQQKQEAINIKKQKELTKQQEFAFYQNQEEVMKAEQQRRDLILDEEKKLAQQRRKLQSLRRDIALQELDAHDKVRRKFLTYQQQMKNLQVQRLDDELNRKIFLRNEETKEVLQDAEIKALEIEAQKRQFKEELMRENIEASFRHQIDKDIVSKQRDHEDDKLQQIIYKAQNVDGEGLGNYQLKLAKAQQEQQNIELEDDIRARNRLWDLEREIATLQITQKNVENKVKETELHHLIHQNVEKTENESSPRKKKDDQKDSVSTVEGAAASLESDQVSRGSFGERELDLMSQVRELRRSISKKGKSALVDIT